MINQRSSSINMNHHHSSLNFDCGLATLGDKINQTLMHHQCCYNALPEEVGHSSLTMIISDPDFTRVFQHSCWSAEFSTTNSTKNMCLTFKQYIIQNNFNCTFFKKSTSATYPSSNHKLTINCPSMSRQLLTNEPSIHHELPIGTDEPPLTHQWQALITTTN